MERMRAKNASIEHYYDRHGWIYPLLWGNTIHWGRFATGQETLAEAAEFWSDWTIELLNPKRGQRILDLGCGPATTDRRLITTRGVTVDAIDVSEFQLRRAQAAAGDLVDRGLLRLVKGDIASVVLEEGAYNGAISMAVFFHLRQRTSVFCNIRHALKPGARFVFDDLVTWRSIPPREFQVAFGRFVNLEFEQGRAYKKLLRDAGFQLLESFDVDHEVARTYMRLLDALDAEHARQEDVLSGHLYRKLRDSFRMIIRLIWDGTLGARQYVVMAA